MNRKGWFAVGMLAAVSLMLAAANGFAAGAQDGAKPAAGAAAYKMVDGYPKYDPPITLTRNMQIAIGGETTFYKNNTVEDNSYTRWFKEKMGIQWVPKWVAPDAETDRQKLSLAMASGDLPDLIKVSGKSFLDLASGGALIEAKPMFDKYASPLIKAVFEEVKTVTGLDPFIQQTVNGKIYGVPMVMDVWAGSDNCTWVRKDILDQLGLPMPKSLQDMEKIFAAYLAKYPGNAPFYMENDWGIPYKWFDTITYNMGAGSSGSGAWISVGGKLEYTGIQKEMRDSLEIAAQWYKKGYINKEFLTAKGNKDLIAGKAMFVFGPWWYIHNVFTDVVKNNPGAEFLPVPLFTEANPKAAYLDGARVLGDGYGISVKAKNPEAIILAYNENVESKLRDQPDLRAKFPFKYDQDTYGKIKGYRVEGPVFFNFPEAKELKEIDTVYLNPSMGINQRIADLYNTYSRIVANLDAKKPDSALSEGDLAMKKQVDERLNANALWENIRMYNREFAAGLHKTNQFFGSPTPTQVSGGGELKKIEQETYTKIILGQVPISAFDEFAAKWKSQGGDAITKEVNDWYKGLKK